MTVIKYVYYNSQLSRILCKYRMGNWGGTPSGNQMEAIKITSSNYGIEYRSHVAYDGWLSWVSDGTMAGTTGQGKSLQAIQIQLKMHHLISMYLIVCMSTGRVGKVGYLMVQPQALQDKAWLLRP